MCLQRAGILSGVILLLVFAQPAGAQDREAAAPADSAEQRAFQWEPYRTERTAMGHALAFPSYVLHYATRPIGAVVIWAERYDVRSRIRDLFRNEARTFGVFPKVTIGGATPSAVGLVMRHERLLGTPREAELGVSYSSPGNLKTYASYANPTPFGEASFVDADVEYRLDSEENLFLTPELPGSGGETRGETSYRIERFAVRLGVGADPPARGGVPGLGWVFLARSEWNEVGRGDGAERFSGALPGAGTTHLLAAGGAVLFDHARGGRSGHPRTSAGGRLYLAYDYTHVLGGPVGDYHRIAGEVQRYVPLRVLGPERRLAFRARLEKVFPAAEAGVPFFKLSTLGTASALRGFEQNRFRDEGSVLVTLEYLYPIWTVWDALLFVDAGQTFGSLSEVRPADFEWAGGFGLRVFSGSGVSLRLDVGFSRDGVRPFLDNGSSFVVSTRR